MSDPIDLLLPRLQGVRRTGPGTWMARCPSHEDRLPSLSVREAPDGRVLINCFGGCGACDVVAALGLDFADLFPPRMEIAYGPPRTRDHVVPRIPAADALKLLDQESFYVWLVAEWLLSGKARVEEHIDDLRRSSARIGEIRRLWEMHQ